MQIVLAKRKRHSFPSLFFHHRLVIHFSLIFIPPLSSSLLFSLYFARYNHCVSTLQMTLQRQNMTSIDFFNALVISKIVQFKDVQRFRSAISSVIFVFASSCWYFLHSFIVYCVINWQSRWWLLGTLISTTRAEKKNHISNIWLMHTHKQSHDLSHTPSMTIDENKNRTEFAFKTLGRWREKNGKTH